MDVYVLAPSTCVSLLEHLLDKELRELTPRGLRATVRKRSSGWIQCRVVESRLFGRCDRGSLLNAVAVAVAEMIVREWEYFVGRRLVRRAAWVEDRDWTLVYRRLQEDRSLLSGYRRVVARRLRDYLRENSRLDVAGFVSFRLPDFVDAIGELAGRILDDALLEQENREFINVLRQFVRRRGQPLNAVHVVLFSGNHFRIYDDRMRVVTKSAEEESPVGDDEVCQEDLLISALVSLAPREVTIHGECMSVTYNTLLQVFPGAVRRCKGCRYCPSSHQA